jgi:hypothetical protein
MADALPDDGQVWVTEPAPMERIVHMHIPKTAGNSLKTAMENCKNRKVRVFPRWHEDEYHSFAPADYDFYSGHIGHRTASKLDGHIVSVFRHPIDRFISVYYFWRHLFNAKIEVRQATIIASKYSLDQFVRIRDVFALSEELCNRMTYQTAYGFNSRDRQWLRTEGNTDEDIYRMAADNVSRFAVVGIQEDLVDFETKIRRRFGLDISIGAVNQNEDRLAAHEISFATKSRILEWVYMDMELYDHVLRLCRERADRAAAEPPLGFDGRVPADYLAAPAR